MSRSNYKNITIEYYNTCAVTEVNKATNSYKRDKIDITELLNHLRSKEVTERSIEYNGENLILSSITYNAESNLWELIFFKSRSATIPFIVNRNGASRQIILKDDEMISEVLCAEYNPKSMILAMQRNVYAVGTRGIEMFFSHFLNYNIYLESIQNLSEGKKTFLKTNKVKKFKLHIKKSKNSSTSIKEYNKKTTISKVIDAALAVDSAIINIEFSVGKSSKIINVEEEDFAVFQDLMDNTDVKCLELGVAPDEKSTMQVTDFMDFRIHDLISIPFTKGQPIDVTEILKKMAEKFTKNIYLK